MTIYFTILIFLFVVSLLTRKRAALGSSNLYTTNITADWYLLIILFSIFIGLRFEIGGDWSTYIFHSSQALNSTSLSEYLDLRGDPGYYFLAYISSKLGAGVFLSNFLCALIFFFCLAKFCRSCPRPYLALAGAFPYLIMVVAMGYTRQSVAIGLSMLAITYLIREKTLTFASIVLLAALFHKSAVLFLGIGLFVITKNRFLSLIFLILTGITSYLILLQSYVEKLIFAYITMDQQSDGALIRIAMNVIPAMIFIFYRNKLEFNPIEKRLVSILSLSAIAMLIAYFLLDISTALDRIALYIIPLQPIIYSRLPDLFPNTFNRSLIYVLVSGYFMTILFVWLNFAGHAYLWVPYQTILIP